MDCHARAAAGLKLGLKALTLLNVRVDTCKCNHHLAVARHLHWHWCCDMSSMTAFCAPCQLTTCTAQPLIQITDYIAVQNKWASLLAQIQASLMSKLQWMSNCARSTSTSTTRLASTLYILCISMSACMRENTCSKARALYYCNNKQKMTSQKQQRRCEICYEIACTSILQNCMPST